MKAKVKATGEIVEIMDYDDFKVTVYRNNETEFFAQNEYSRDEVEFPPPDTPEETSLNGWICRDKDGDLNFFYGGDKPRKEDGEDYWCATFGSNFEYLPKSLYPNVTWETEPQKVKITITPIQ